MKKIVKNHDKLNIKSYHSTNDCIINNCTVTDGNLKPCNNMATVDRRPPNISLARMSVDLDFHKLDKNHTTLPFTYYICLITETKPVNNHQDPPLPVAGGLTTFHGRDDWNSSKEYFTEV